MTSTPALKRGRAVICRNGAVAKQTRMRPMTGHPSTNFNPIFNYHNTELAWYETTTEVKRELPEIQPPTALQSSSKKKRKPPSLKPYGDLNAGTISQRILKWVSVNLTAVIIYFKTVEYLALQMHIGNVETGPNSQAKAAPYLHSQNCTHILACTKLHCCLHHLPQFRETQISAKPK